MEALDANFREQLSLLVWFKVDGGYQRVGWNATRHQSDLLGNAQAIGSGSRRLDLLEPRFDLGVLNGSPNDFSKMVVQALTSTGILLQLEQVSLETWASLFGGAYELIVPLNHKFTKLGDLSYAFWPTRVSREGVRIDTMRCFLKLHYADDVLVICALRQREDGGFGEDLFIVSPTHREVAISELRALGESLPELNSRFTCNYFFVEDTVRGHGIYSQVDYSAIGLPNSVRVRRAEKQYDLSINHHFMERVARRLEHFDGFGHN